MYFCLEATQSFSLRSSRGSKQPLGHGAVATVQVRFRLEKTQDEFRLARIDLTREELEKIPASERMQLLESKCVRGW